MDREKLMEACAAVEETVKRAGPVKQERGWWLGAVQGRELLAMCALVHALRAGLEACGRFRIVTAAQGHGAFFRARSTSATAIERAMLDAAGEANT